MPGIYKVDNLAQIKPSGKWKLEHTFNNVITVDDKDREVNPSVASGRVWQLVSQHYRKYGCPERAARAFLAVMGVICSLAIALFFTKSRACLRQYAFDARGTIIYAIPYKKPTPSQTAIPNQQTATAITVNDVATPKPPVTPVVPPMPIVPANPASTVILATPVVTIPTVNSDKPLTPVTPAPPPPEQDINAFVLSSTDLKAAYNRVKDLNAFDKLSAKAIEKLASCMDKKDWAFLTLEQINAMDVQSLTTEGYLGTEEVEHMFLQRKKHIAFINSDRLHYFMEFLERDLQHLSLTQFIHLDLEKLSNLISLDQATFKRIYPEGQDAAIGNGWKGLLEKLKLSKTSDAEKTIIADLLTKDHWRFLAGAGVDCKALEKFKTKRCIYCSESEINASKSSEPEEVIWD